MNIALYSDNTLSLPLRVLVDGLNKVSKVVQFTVGEERFHLWESFISHPSTHKGLPQRLLEDIAKVDMAVLATITPYDNNFFFVAEGNAVIVSFFGWNQLTDLPITNGLVYFTASLILDRLHVGQTHEQNIGCINDFWGDKRGVNAGMRAAFICSDCRGTVKVDTPELSDVEAILDLLSRASRMGRDIVELLSSSPAQAQSQFDVFLCHNSIDKPSVRELNNYFKGKGLKTWLDEEQLPLGRPWQVEIEKRIADIRTAVVFVGASGLGPWQDMEIRAFLNEFIQRGVPVIPVILSSATSVPELPIFLRAMTWVDLRRDPDRGLARLIETIRTHKGV